ncbi:WD40 repeat protein, partial [Spiromyces aspiralis]
MAATMMCEGNHRTVSLLSDSSIYLYDCDFGALDDNSQLDLCWHVSQIPLAYISDNWPIKYAVVNLEGTRVAIAGKHGLAHYSLETQKWHLFQSQAQERLLQCEGGLVWFGSFMVASMTRFDVDGGEAQDSLAAGTGGPPGPDRLGARSAAGQHQIIIFAADAPLDLEQAQTTMTLPSRVVTMSIAGSLLLVYCEDGYLRQFYLFEDRGIINASLRQPLCLDGRLVLGDPHMVRSIQCLPSALFDINPSLVVHEGRHLSLLTDLLLVGEGELDSGGQSDSRSDGDGQTP